MQGTTRSFRISALQLALLMFLTLAALACADRSTAADRSRLEQVARDYASEFELHPWADTYLHARHRRVGCPSVAQAKELYRAFWFAAGGEARTDTSFIYLNVEDDKGDFCFQLFWDGDAGSIKESNQEYY